MQGLTKTQIIGLIGFLLILISIPLSFTLAKQSQIFRSRASEQKTNTTTKSVGGTVTTPRPIPSTSPLTELQKLVQGGEVVSPTPAAAENLAFGPTLNFSVAIEGRPVGKQAGKVFIGIAPSGTAIPPTYILTFTVDMPDSGIFNGISLAGLNPGSTYTAYIKGAAQIDTTSTFTMSPTESNLNNGQALTLISGDLNEDNTVNSADYTIARNVYNTTPKSANWNERADFNRDNIINNWDLLYINNNMGKTGVSGTWVSAPKANVGGLASPVGGPPSNFGDLLQQSSPSASGSASPTGNYWLLVP